MSEGSNKLIKAIKDKGKTLEAEMSFFDHLEALRWHLIRACIAIVIFTGFAFAYYTWIFKNIIMAPSKMNFWTYTSMCNLGHWLHHIFPSYGFDFCFSEIHIQLMNTEMAGQFMLQMNSSLIIGITAGVP